MTPGTVFFFYLIFLLVLLVLFILNKCSRRVKEELGQRFEIFSGSESTEKSDKDCDNFYEAINSSDRASLICEEVRAYNRLGISRMSKNELKKMVLSQVAEKNRCI